MTRTRRIHKSASRGNVEVAELLEALFVAELLVPSRRLWIVSPWLTDLSMIDNRSNAFSSINPQWGARKIHLVEVLSQLLRMGSEIVVATRSDPHNQVFLKKLRDQARSMGVESQLTIHGDRDELHRKGILGDDFYLNGSMNFTFNGVSLLDEDIVFERNPEAFETARVAFHDSYGGVA